MANLQMFDRNKRSHYFKTLAITDILLYDPDPVLTCIMSRCTLDDIFQHSDLNLKQMLFHVFCLTFVSIG